MQDFVNDGKQSKLPNKKSPGRALMHEVKRAILTKLFYGDSAADVSDPNILHRYQVTPHAVTSIVVENHEERLLALERRFPPSMATTSYGRRATDFENVRQMPQIRKIA